ncbi:MAG: sigma-70 family RNA polymerase sigma factor, partial [Pyrinomonadaceae bacterium]
MQNAVPIEPVSDHTLLEAAKKDDEAAFAEIICRYRNPITNYLYRMLNDYEEAVILAEETFVRVYFALKRYKPDYAFSTYIYRVATNLAVSEIRRRKRRKFLSLTGLFQTGEKSEIKVNLQNAGFIENQPETVVAQAI